MPRARKTFVAILVFLLMVAIGAALVRWRSPVGLDLTQVAVPIGSSNSLPALLASDSQLYAWLSTNVLFTIVDEAPGQLAALQVNLQTGERTALPELDLLLQGLGAPGQIFQWKLAPDGQRLLLISGPTNQVTASATTLDGTLEATWIIPWPSPEIHWLPDGRTWVQFIPSRNRWLARLYKTHTPAVEEMMFDSTTPPTGFLHNDHFLEAQPPGLQANRQMVLRQIPFPPGTDRPKTFFVTLPVNAHLNNLHVSPDGRRLLWEFTMLRMTGRFTFTPRFPFFETGSKYVISLWSSHADGTQLQELGRLPANAWIRSTQWMPGHTGVTFIRDHQLWHLTVAP